jgi:hypothetical protein
MGEILMKELFKKENRILASCDKKTWNQSFTLSILIILLFATCAGYFFDFVYMMCDIIGSIISSSSDIALRDIVRSLPYLSSTIGCIFVLGNLHILFRNYNKDITCKRIFKHSITIIVFGTISALAPLIGLGTKVYSSLIEGSPTDLYPLDQMLTGLVLIVIGVLSVIITTKLKNEINLSLPTRGVENKKCRVIANIGKGIWLLVALFSFSATIYFFKSIDLSNGYVFYSIMLFILFILPWVYMMIYEFHYLELKEEVRKEHDFIIGLVGTIISLVSIILFFISLSLNIDGPSNVGFGLLPVDFTASINVFNIIYPLTIVTVPMVKLIQGIIYKKN